MADAEDSRKGNAVPRSADELRRHAEELIDGLADPEADPVSTEDATATLHELRVHQIELEMQNEELSRAQLELDARRAKYYRLFDLAPVGYLTLSDKGMVGDANLTAARLLRTERRLLVGQPFSAFVFAADHSAYYRHLIALQETDAPLTFELRLQRVGRTTGEDTGPSHFWALLEGRPQPAADGEDSVFWVTFTDITERKLAEEALRVSEERLQQLLEAENDFAWEVDENGTYTFVSSQVTDILGYEPAEMIGKTLFDFVPTEDAAASAMQFGVIISELAPFRDLASVNRHRDGHFVVLEANGGPFFDVAGALLGYRGTGRDVTERRLAEEELRSSAERRQTILRTAMDGFLLLAADTRVLEVNDAYCEMSGYSEAELLTMRISDLVVPETPDEVAVHAARIAERRLDRFESQHRRKDGSLFDVEISIRYEAMEGGLFAGFVRDITERRQAEQALRVSEERLRQLVESAHDFVWEVDASGAYTFLSPQVHDILGYDPEEMIGKTPYDFRSPENAAAVAPEFTGVDSRAEAFQEMVTELRQKDGRLVVLETNGIPFVGASGDHLGWRGTSRDVTGRIEAENALRDSANRYETILQTAIDGFALVGMEGHLLEVNEAYVEMCGYSKEELLAMRFPDLVPSENANDIADHMKAVLDNGRDRFESRHLRKDGNVFDMELSVQYRPTHGGQIAAFIRDITERKQAERLLVLQSEVLNNLAGRSTTAGAVRGIVEAVQRATGLDAVGLRLPQGDDYPFFASVGYADDFLKTENALAVSYPDGGLCRNEDGSVMLECTCGLVLRGDFEPTDPLFTPRGSVWTNDSTVLLELPPAQDPRLSPRNKCIHVGFRSIALIPLRAGDEIFGLLHLADRRKDRFTPGSIRFFEGVCSSVGTALRRMRAEEEIRRQKERIDRTLASVIEIAGRIGEARDAYTAGHQRRVSQIALRISQEMGMTAEQNEEIRVASLLHDIGKMSVPAELLSKPGKLSSAEFELIKGHAEASYLIIASADMEGSIAEIVHEHHERCDGSGYPRGLAADELLPESKVLMVADVVEAMMSHRPYRVALGIDVALAEIERGAGTLYDTDVCRACVAVFRERGFALSEV